MRVVQIYQLRGISLSRACVEYHCHQNKRSFIPTEPGEAATNLTTNGIVQSSLRTAVMIRTRLRSGTTAKRISTLTPDVPVVKTKKKPNQSQASGSEDNLSTKEDVEQAMAPKMVPKRTLKSKPVKIQYSNGALKEEQPAEVPKTKKKPNPSQASGSEDNPSIKEGVEQAMAPKMVPKRTLKSKPVKIQYSDGALREEQAAEVPKTKKKPNQSQASGSEDNPSIKEGVEQAMAPKTVPKRKPKLKPVKIQCSDGDLKEEQPAEASPYFAWKPDNWEQVLNNIRQMRGERDAPVDSMGCDKCPDQTLPEKLVRYQLLVSLMLSSQTKDEVTHAAVGRLQEFGLTPEAVSNAEEKQLEELIYPVSFYKNKAKHLKRTSQTLLEEYDGDIPDSIEGLCKLPGVGPKMGYLAMSCGWKRTVGIGVDTHVHRISNWLGWVPQPTKTPEQTRKALEAWLPRDLWNEVNHLLVGFGQTVCKPVAPKCSSCLNLQLCPYGRKQVKPKKGAT